MPDSVTIRIQDNGALISSPGPVPPGGTVRFQNDAAAIAKVQFGDESPFCPQKRGYQIKADRKKTLDVCGNYGIGGTYNYTATVGNATQSGTLTVTSLTPGTDPIVIVEKKPIVIVEDWIPLLAGLAVGAVLGYFGGKRRVMRRS